MVFKLDMSKVLKLWKIWDISTLVGAFFIYVYLGVYNYDIVQPFLELQVYGSLYFVFALLCLIVIILELLKKSPRTNRNVIIFSIFFSLLRFILLIYTLWIRFYNINFGPVNGVGGQIMYYTSRPQISCIESLNGTLRYENLTKTNWHFLYDEGGLQEFGYRICGKPRIYKYEEHQIGAISFQSDVHFNPWESMKNVDLQVMVGDLSNGGRPYEYKRVFGTLGREVSNRLRLWVNGNHDTFRTKSHETAKPSRVQRDNFNVITEDIYGQPLQFIAINPFNTDILEMPRQKINQAITYIQEVLDSQETPVRTFILSHMPVFTDDGIKESPYFQSQMLFILSQYPQIVHIASGHSHYDGFWALPSGQTLSIGGFAGVSTDKDPQGMINEDSLGLAFRQFISLSDGHFKCELEPSSLKWSFINTDGQVLDL